MHFCGVDLKNTLKLWELLICMCFYTDIYVIASQFKKEKITLPYLLGNIPKNVF